MLLETRCLKFKCPFCTNHSDLFLFPNSIFSGCEIADKAGESLEVGKFEREEG
jgi:hypothetical protein